MTPTIEDKKYDELESILLAIEVPHWDWLRCKGTTPNVYQAIIDAMFAASLNRQGLTRVEDLIAELKTWVTANSENHTDMDIAYWNVIKYLERLKSMPLPNKPSI